MKYPSIISNPTADRKSGCQLREDLKKCVKRREPSGKAEAPVL